MQHWIIGCLIITLSIGITNFIYLFIFSFILVRIRYKGKK